MRYVVGMMALAAAFQAFAATPPVREGNVDAAALLKWVTEQKAIPANVAVQANNKSGSSGTGFCKQCSDANSKPTSAPKTVSLYENAKTVFFEADMDIDCDGSGNGICGGTDPSHQNQLSCDDFGKCSKDNGGPIDAANYSFYVVPIGSPFNASARGVTIGQLAVIINSKVSPPAITYAPFLDEDGVAQEIGEASAHLAGAIGVPNDPNTGGQDNGITYIIFRGASGHLGSVADWANHQKAIDVGQTLAQALLGSTGIPAHQTTLDYRYNGQSVSIGAQGSHTLSIFDLKGENLMRVTGMGAAEYDLSRLQSRAYILKVSTANGTFTEKLVR